MDSFAQNQPQLTLTEAPLAARMRPRTLEEFIGQDHIIDPGRLLRRAIQADQLSSIIFSGPPGTGKTTLARIIANTTKAYFIAINAVLSGVKEIRDAISTAQEKQKKHSQRTILFVDEVHRFNKSQQDALLPWVENGTVILIGATTENPYFEVNKALVSRSRIFQLKLLNDEDLHRIIEQTLNDSERGYGKLKVKLETAAVKHLVNVANGDARSLLNALELAVETTPPNKEGTIQITLAVAEESIQQRAVLYDKEGDAHFDTISAFIKSLRGSDPDAALYWLAKMVYAGEDLRFIFRRMLILASEDVGLADPNAIVVVNACAEAFDRVGMPEGRYHLAQATLYLANTAKSNSVMGFFDALSVVEKEKEAEVPPHLKDANRDKKGFGHGAGYLYPHAYRDHWVAQQYLPASLQGQVFYQPSQQGFEGGIASNVARRREAQLVASIEGVGIAPTEVLTYGTTDRATERWLQRTLSQVGEQLGRIRDRIFSLTQIQRHYVILDLNAGSGLLTWEAVRQVPEGGVYACVRNSQEASALEEQAAALPELVRPFVVTSTLAELPNVLAAEAANVRFDYIIGRNVLTQEPDKNVAVQKLAKLIPKSGVLVLAESVPHHTQRLYRWLEDNGILGDVNALPGNPRQVLIASTSTLSEFGLKPGELKENLLVDTQVEQFSSGTVLQVGSLALIRLTFPCEPCSYLDELQPGLAKKIKRKRGFLGMIIRDGEVLAGDEVKLTSYQFKPLPDEAKGRFAEFVQRIPSGKVVKTMDLLMAMGVSKAYARAIPTFLKKANPHLPIHRIVRVDGRLLSEYVTEQVRSLLAEGVKIEQDKIADPTAYWDTSQFHELGNF